MKYITFLNIIFLSNILLAQLQIDNSNFEIWENVGASNEEPTNWNSFKSATGTWSAFGAQQLKQSAEVRPGSTGIYSAQLWTRDASLAIANGNMTLGQINMGSTTPDHADNYNISKITDVSFSEILTLKPDSIVFWTKFSPINASHEARISCIIHDNVAFKDPNDVGNSTTVATAISNFATTNGNWIRKSIPFSYSTNTNAQYILCTFTTNKTPGVGTDDGTESTRDNLWIDDVELIYNGSNVINETSTNLLNFTHQNSILSLFNPTNLKGNFTIYNSNGSIILNENLNSKEIEFNVQKGIYFIQINSEAGNFTKKLLVNE
jgi:hypothetical protein